MPGLRLTATLDPRKAGLLEPDVIIIVEIVDADHLVASRQQLERKGGADKTRNAGDQDFHAVNGAT